MSNAPKFDLRGANIGNLADTVKGDQIAHIQNQSEQNFEQKERRTPPPRRRQVGVKERWVLVVLFERHKTVS